MQRYRLSKIYSFLQLIHIKFWIKLYNIQWYNRYLKSIQNISKNWVHSWPQTMSQQMSHNQYYTDSNILILN